MFENKEIKINISDFLKVFAVTAVMMQTVLSFALANVQNEKTAAFIGIFYVIVKYTAPMFIFAIVYNMVKTSQHLSYWEFLKEKFFELVVPYLLWTTAYLWLFPAVQQGQPYTDTASFLLKYITGDGAPHLWYTVMMLQIQLLMPFFVWLGYKVFSNKKNVWPVLIVTTVLYVAWYLFYDVQVFAGPHHDNWYLLDRFVANFVIYGIYGEAALMYHEAIYRFLYKMRYALLPVGLVLALFSADHLLHFSGDLSFAHAPYLNTLQSLYSLVVIFGVFMLGSTMIKNNAPQLRAFKWLSVYAYRTYLANVFVFQVILVCFKDTLLQLPTGIMILVAYLATASCSFLLSYLLHVIWSGIKGPFSN
ncbi:acyltransferase family protein [Enterococcus gallinarum]|uniref:acyltransferase family protein n=1 Tax=Enterococcus gallinarum TaxID=1353 RepID=UPI001F58928F|nr:acyltransferase [Enterococcus gallinarum]MCR1944419.1 acyltransferase [Enterococcus gallinarum]